MKRVFLACVLIATVIMPSFVFATQAIPRIPVARNVTLDQSGIPIREESNQPLLDEANGNQRTAISTPRTQRN